MHTWLLAGDMRSIGTGWRCQWAEEEEKEEANIKSGVSDRV